MENQSAWESIKGAFTHYDPRVWVGVVVMIVVFTVEMILCSKGILVSRSERRLRKAKAAGHMLRATMKSCNYKDKKTGTKCSERIYTAIYEYEANGRVRRTSVITTGIRPPETLTMYYVSDPGKAFSEYQVGCGRLHFLLLLIPIAVGIAVTMGLGYRV